METKEIKEMKKVINYLKIALHSDHITFRAMVEGETFRNEVVKPLEKIVKWNEEDEKSAKELAEKFKKETEGKTLKEKSGKISKILKIGRRNVGLISVIAGGIGVAAYQMLKKNGAGK